MAEEIPSRYVDTYSHTTSAGPPSLLHSSPTPSLPFRSILANQQLPSPPGLDLQGNTYWEFRDARGDDAPGRWRRIVQYPRDTHYGDVRPSPQWHQWLRHLRDAPPTLREQRDDLARRQRIKLLAADADARWAAKPRLVGDVDDLPGRPVAALEGMAARRGAEVGREGGEASSPGETEEGAIASEEQAAQSDTSARNPADPWKQNRRAGPSEDWQPQAWTPPASKR